MPSAPPRLHTTLLVSAATTGGACSVFALSGPAGARIPPHRRGRNDACVVVLTGAAALRVEEEATRLGPGEVGWLPRATACRLELIEESRLLLVAVPAGFEELVGTGGAVPDADDLAVLLGLAGVQLLPDGWGARQAATH